VDDIWIYNIYSPSPTTYKLKDDLIIIPLIAEVLKRLGEYILLGDFNLHYPRWNNKGRSIYYAVVDVLLGETSKYSMEVALLEGTVI